MSRYRTEERTARIEDAGAGQLALYSSYDEDLVQRLKDAIPPSERAWDGNQKRWLFAPKHGQAVADLVYRYLAIRVEVPRVNAIGLVKLETRMLRVVYLGLCKDRGDGKPTASATLDERGESWSVVFPETVLRAWFEPLATEPDPAKPTQAGTLYAVLMLPQSPPPTDDAIRSSFRRLARQWHPDVCREPNAAAQFKRIKDAYDVLLDPIKRTRYDAGLAFAAATVQTDRHGYASNYGYGAITYTDDKYGYRSPLRCGWVLVVGAERFGKFVVSKIEQWTDITDATGQTMVSSWAAGAKAPTIGWA